MNQFQQTISKQSFRIISWNTRSSKFDNGVLRLLEKKPDVLLLQECGYPGDRIAIELMRNGHYTSWDPDDRNQSHWGWIDFSTKTADDDQSNEFNYKTEESIKYYVHWWSDYHETNFQNNLMCLVKKEHAMPMLSNKKPPIIFLDNYYGRKPLVGLPVSMGNSGQSCTFYSFHLTLRSSSTTKKKVAMIDDMVTTMAETHSDQLWFVGGDFNLQPHELQDIEKSEHKHNVFVVASGNETRGSNELDWGIMGKMSDKKEILIKTKAKVYTKINSMLGKPSDHHPVKFKLKLVDV